jgi:hypothetical protein
LELDGVNLTFCWRFAMNYKRRGPDLNRDILAETSFLALSISRLAQYQVVPPRQTLASKPK